MKDITSKISTLRIATASAKVKVSSVKSIEAIKGEENIINVRQING